MFALIGRADQGQGDRKAVLPSLVDFQVERNLVMGSLQISMLFCALHGLYYLPQVRITFSNVVIPIVP